MRRLISLSTLLLCSLSVGAFADGGTCSKTTAALYRACIFSAADDLSVATANCLNGADVAPCLRDAQAARKEALSGCVDKRESRDDICDAVGEAAYRPHFGAEFAADFVDPAAIGHGVLPNPFLPLIPGNTWVYKKHVVDSEGDAEVETTTVTVTNDTKMIDGIQCRVVHDTNFVDDELAEDTVDWLAQDIHGNVWYCGENTAEYLVFDADQPKTPELQQIDGSFKAGRDSAKAGILMPGAPVAGRTYREEASWNNAEDVSKVLSLTGTARVPAARCTGTCLVISDFTPLEPGHTESKYFVRGIGQILTVSDQSGTRSELAEFTHR